MSARALECMEYAARRLNITEARAYQLAREGVLPVIRLGRQIRVDPDAIEEFIRSGGKALPGGWRKDAETK